MQIARLRAPELVLLEMLLLGVSLTATGQAKHAAGSLGQRRFAEAADRVFREGLNAKIPPHLSTLLGLSKALECPVKQGLVRTGKMVQGFDVSVADKNEIVLFVAEEGSNNQTLYLTSPRGKLRKLVSVKNGEGSVAKITDEDTKTFEREKAFWLARLAPSRVPQ